MERKWYDLCLGHLHAILKKKEFGMSLIDDRLNGQQEVQDRIGTDRPWTYNPADPYDISTPIGASDYFRLRDQRTREPLETVFPRSQRSLTRHASIFFVLVFGTILIGWLS